MISVKLRFIFLSLPCLFLTSPAPAQEATSLLHALKARCIGPANMSGRITDVAVLESRPSTMYVASASGGVWKTVNNGTTWKPLFDQQSTSAIGAVAVAPSDPNVVWVGTGEGNPRNSVSWGDGVYRSADGGLTWQNMGLKDTHHIGRIVIHPSNPAIVYVAALGQLWGPNAERGLFQTTDGGKTWNKILAGGDQAGCIDVAMDPSDPQVLYAAMWQVRRDAFSGGNPAVMTGPESGLFRTVDGGRSWEKMTDGLPERPLGRCGFSIYRKDPNVLFAVIQTDKTPATVEGQKPNQKLQLDAGGVFRSDDKGKTWKHLNSLVTRPFYYGQIRVDPSDDQRLWVLGVQLHVSKDGGKTFSEKGAAPGTHVDYHAMWIDPRDGDHLVLGCDGGLNFSYDRGATWEYLKNLPVSQFYNIGVDQRTPYRVYGGLQDNGSWMGASASRDLAGITLAEWVRLLGFDGYYAQVHPQDENTVFVEGQYGKLRRVNLKDGGLADIQPRLNGVVNKVKVKTNLQPPPAEKTPPFRFNWNSPILVSTHPPHTLYYGGNHVFRSDDRGNSWTVLGPDLTRGNPGPSKYSGHTLTVLTESPLKRGLLWVGTDDGKVQVSPDGGKEWIDLSEKIPLPPDRWITRIEPSRWSEGTAFMTIDRHRNGDRAPYLFKTIDHGNSWVPLTGNLPPNGPLHAFREDLRNKDLLYVGTEYGLFVSMDAGVTWHRQKNLPTVPVHDLVVHPRERELVIGTHGRGIWIMDVVPLQDFSSKVQETPAHLFEVKPANAFRRRALTDLGIKAFTGENPPYGASIYLYLAKPGAPEVTIQDAAGKKVLELKASKEAGLQRLGWNLNKSGSTALLFNPVPSGEYTVTVKLGDFEQSRRFRVQVDSPPEPGQAELDQADED